MHSPLWPAKQALRERLVAARAALDAGALAAAAAALTSRVRAVPEVAAARTVAAYVSVGREPATRALLDAWHAAGARVLLPVLRPDRDLDWAEYAGPDSLLPAGRGLLEPAGTRIGTAAVGEADAVVVPALAVDRRGVRLGRGAGCYDRALARVPAGRFVVALLYDGEVLDELPAEDHDRRVAAAVTPAALHRFPAG